jgi:hypothetical protein
MRLFQALVIVNLASSGHSFSAVNPSVASSSTSDTSSSICNNNNNNNNNILILDHLNINHQQGRHDWLTAFYVDFLQCALDPRKMENVAKGKKTIWANVGAQQFHLPEGKPDAQVLDGVVTLVYPDLAPLLERFESVQPVLAGSLFEILTKDIKGVDDSLLVVDPWGSKFQLVQGNSVDDERDGRGNQPGDKSEGLAMRDLTIHTPPNANLAGIGRFYEQVLGSVVVVDKKEDGNNRIQIQVGPRQTLTFQTNPTTTVDSHVDLRDEADVEVPPSKGGEGGAPQHFLSNYGPHLSMYVADLPSAYRRAEALGLPYVNPRFSRRAYTLDEAIDDCMFRCLDIIDPEYVQEGSILKLEHEIRSVVKRDGTKYKSCPFDEIPEVCKTSSQQ